MYDNELMHYGVKGMKWGRRRAEKYEARAKKYRYLAQEYDPKNRKGISDKERNKLTVKKSKLEDKAANMDVRARMEREGKVDLKKLKDAAKMGDGYYDTKGILHGSYANAVNSIAAKKKRERYARELQNKYQGDVITEVALGTSVLFGAYVAGAAYIINRM